MLWVCLSPREYILFYVKYRKSSRWWFVCRGVWCGCCRWQTELISSHTSATKTATAMDGNPNAVSLTTHPALLIVYSMGWFSSWLDLCSLCARICSDYVYSGNSIHSVCAWKSELQSYSSTPSTLPPIPPNNLINITFIDAGAMQHRHDVHVSYEYYDNDCCLYLYNMRWLGSSRWHQRVDCISTYSLYVCVLSSSALCLRYNRECVIGWLLQALRFVARLASSNSLSFRIDHLRWNLLCVLVCVCMCQTLLSGIFNI